MKKRLVDVTLTALLPAIGMLAHNELAARSERDLEVHRQAAQAARQVGSEVTTVIEGIRGLLIAMASIPSIIDGDPAACDSILKTVASQLTPVKNILVLNSQGKLVCDSMGWETGTDFSNRTYFQEAMKTDELVVGEYTVSQISTTPVLPMALALKRDGQTVGVVATGVRLDWLSQRIAQRGLADGSSVTIADRNGVVLSRNPNPEDFVGTTILDHYRHLVTEPVPGTVEVLSQDGTERILGYEPVSPTHPLYVSAGISKAEALGPINRATRIGLAMMLIGGALAFAAATIIGNKFVIEPINHVVATLARWRDGDQSVRTRMEGHYGELGLVGASIDGLLDELEARRCASVRAEEKRKLMARELAHRVKNTLAVIQTIARQTYRGQPVENASFAQRIKALAGGYDVLLSEDWQGADLLDVVERALKPYLGDGDDRITMSGDHHHLPPDAALGLSLILHELGTNAVKYGSLSVPEGKVAIAWKKQDETISLSWVERGGPAVSAPANQGFGSKLIQGAFPSMYEPQITSDFKPGGLEFKLSFKSIEDEDTEGPRSRETPSVSAA